MTVTTGAPGTLRSLARTAGPAVNPWKAAITAGRWAATARATLWFTGRNSVC